MSNSEDLNCFYNTFVINTSGGLDRALLRVSQPGLNHFLDVENCTFSISNPQTAFVTAYDVYANPAVPTKMQVHTNTFNLLNPDPLVTYQLKHSTGIKITGDLIAGSDLDIEQGNTFNINPFAQNFNVGLELTGGTHRNGLHFINNEFYCSGIGIRLDGSVIGEDNQVSDNRFHTVTDIFGWGMDIASFEGLMVCANSFYPNSIRDNYVFSGQSMSTNFVGNGTQSGRLAILPNATIGQQIDKGNHWLPLISPNGNVLYRPPLTNGNTIQSVVEASLFIVNEPQSIWDPGTNTYIYLSLLHPDNIWPDAFPLEDAFFDDGGGTQDPICITQIGATTSADYGDVAIAQGTFDSWFSQPAIGWDAGQYLYRKLHLYPGYVNAHGAFPTFLTAQAGTTVGKFYNLEQKVQEAGAMPTELVNQAVAIQAEIADIEEEIAALSPTYPPSATYLDLLEEQSGKIEELKAVAVQFAAYAASKLTEAWNFLPGITTANAHEWNKKRVYEVYIGSQLFQGGAFTEIQIADLKTIGQQCIEDGGKTVLLARGLLSECDYAAIRATVEACYPPVEERSQQQSLEKTHAGILIAPNPASSYLRIFSPANGNLEIYSADGKLQSQRNILAGETRLSASLLPGFYLFHFRLSDGTTSIRKVTIQ